MRLRALAAFCDGATPGLLASRWCDVAFCRWLRDRGGLRFFEPDNWVYYYYRVQSENASQTTAPDYAFADAHLAAARRAVSPDLRRDGLALAGAALAAQVDLFASVHAGGGPVAADAYFADGARFVLERLAASGFARLRDWLAPFVPARLEGSAERYGIRLVGGRGGGE